MALTIQLDALFSKQAREARAAILARLRAGVGSTGRPLAPLARGTGTLGGERVPSGILGSVADFRPDGWSLTFDNYVALFHRGHADQPKRPIAGFTREERARWNTQVEDEVARQLEAQIARGS